MNMNSLKPLFLKASLKTISEHTSINAVNIPLRIAD